MTHKDRAVRLAALWAQRLGLPRGNYWEPGIVRAMERDAKTLGDDSNAWALTEARYLIQLGLDHD